MKTRLIYISSSQSLKTLKSKYEFVDHSIKTGDYLFKICEFSEQEKDVLCHLNNELKPFFTIAFLAQTCLFLKVIPEMHLLAQLENYKSANLTIDDLIARIVSYFSNSTASPKWQLGTRNLDFNNKPLVMGILNTTPDSFSDGGLYSDKKRAFEHAMKMIKEGADIIDVGGESSRPGAQSVTEEEELQRTIPVIQHIRKHSTAFISIDTCKSAVARQALLAGADIINDISAAEYDPQMKTVIKEFNCPLVIMHKKGSPWHMQDNPSYEDVQEEVYDFLENKCLEMADLNEGKIIIDPGIGFGKTLQHNLALIRDVHDFTFIGKPILLGVSRKSFIGKSLAVETNDRLVGSLVSGFYSVLNGVSLLRVHDIQETVQAKKMIANIMAA